MRIIKANRKVLSLLLCLGMVLSVLAPASLGNVYASETETAFSATAGDAENVSVEESAEVTEEAEADSSDKISEEKTEEAEAPADTDNITDNTDTEETSSDEGLIQSELDINFAVIEEAEFETPAMNKFIVVDMGDGSTAFEDATLVILNETTGKEYEIKVDTVNDSSLLFYADFPDSSFSGKYLIEKVIYSADGEEFVKHTADDDMMPRFGVNKQISDTPDGWIDDGETETTSVSDIAETSSEIIDLSDDFENADAIGVNAPNSDISISNESSRLEENLPEEDIDIVNIEESGKEMAEQIISHVKGQPGSMTSTSGNVIIVLDPGHGANDPGAVRTFDGVYYCERDINQKIANACKAELQKNPEVTVYMTRNSTTEAFHGSKEQDLAWRSKFAGEMHADLFVSLHCNSAAATTAKGAEVYVPNKSLHENNYTVGQVVGNAIMNKLVELGLYKRGVIVKNSATGDKYDDGSICDYYAVIRGCKKLGIPGMIVEHDFISNPDECKKFFGSDEVIASLGVADAQGILACIDTLKQYRTGGGPDTVAGDWDTVDGHTVFRDANGNVVTGFFSHEDKTYYADSNGYVVTGLKTINGKKYFFEDSGVMSVNIWKTIGGVKYYFTETGAMAKSQWVNINGKIYYFKSNGKRYGKGWRKIGSKYYYFRKGGSVETNKWKKNGANQRYLGSDGRAATGLTTIKSSVYYFNKYGYKQFGWVKVGSKKYYMSWKNGKALKGWQTIWGKKYYFSKTDFSLQTGFTLVGKKTYYLLSSGGVLTGWQKIKGKIYNFDYKGVMKTGWTTYGGHKAYLKDDTGELAKKTFVTVGKGKYKGKTFYFDKKYKYVTGFRSIKKERYYFDKNGVMAQSQWVEDEDGNTYYARDNGIFSHDRFETIGDFKYYFDSNGQYVTGTQVIPYNGTPYTYVFDESGRLISGDGPATNYEDDAAAAAATPQPNTDATGMYLIMGPSGVTVDQMVARYNSSGKTYPSAALKAGGAETITQFCTILKEEADAEGVKAQVLFAQVMVETGWLQFGGDVKVGQFNFGGIGATGGGNPGLSFADVRTGLRVQTQHLKAYASTEGLNNPCIDERFKYVTRGCAPYVEYLGIKENPSGKGWASGEKYGSKLLEVINSIK